MYLPLHELWQQYMKQVFTDNPYVITITTTFVMTVRRQAALLPQLPKAEYHGAIITGRYENTCIDS